jgi:hypothetical protein
LAKAEPITTHRIHIVSPEKHRAFWTAFEATDPNRRPWFFRDLGSHNVTITTRITEADATQGMTWARSLDGWNDASPPLVMKADPEAEPGVLPGRFGRTNRPRPCALRRGRAYSPRKGFARMPKKQRPKKTVSAADADQIRNNKVPFFVPDAASPEQAEQEYGRFCANSGAPVDQRRIRAIRYVHSGDEYFEEVGAKTPTPRLEQVLAIVSRDDYHMICTTDRGARVFTTTITVGHGEMREVHYFDGGSERSRFF